MSTARAPNPKSTTARSAKRTATAPRSSRSRVAMSATPRREVLDPRGGASVDGAGEPGKEVEVESGELDPDGDVVADLDRRGLRDRDRRSVGHQRAVESVGAGAGDLCGVARAHSGDPSGLTCGVRCGLPGPEPDTELDDAEEQREQDQRDESELDRGRPLLAVLVAPPAQRVDVPHRPLLRT